MKTPTKYKLKKLRGKGYVKVDQQILTWRKFRKSLIAPREVPAKTSHNERKGPLKAITTEEPTPTPNWNMFEE